jgi:hypothetical protein
MEESIFHLVCHFEECSPGVYCEFQVHFLGTSLNISYFNYCWFSLAIKGRAVKQ